MPFKDRLNIISIIESIEKIFEYTKGYEDADQFYQNSRDFDAVLMNFIIIGEMVNRLSEEFLEDQRQINWSKIRGFRNIVAHDYFGIDAEEVWDIIQNHLPPFLIELKNL
ncbi:MAG: hypothetical protein COT43_12200 [Candidatus Marinimicrobia bacterium CG08_land_8_20_14_0_20_45_22]|nr:MAG: hypothetical protein COT43_12200 [Candidatus Marinimicrobia bacterium CG08_land_8_20_14_0_20_45_22]